MTSENEKTVFVCSVKCPSCKAGVNILKKVKTITPAEKAVKEESFFAEKGVQTTLSMHSMTEATDE